MLVVTSFDLFVESQTVSAVVGVASVFSVPLADTEIECGAVTGIPEVAICGTLEQLAGIGCGTGGAGGDDLFWWQGVAFDGSVELGSDGGEQGVFLAETLSSEVVGFQRPDHASSESFLDDVVNLEMGLFPWLPTITKSL